MKSFFGSILISLTILLAACGSPAPETLPSATSTPAPVINTVPSDVVVASAVAAPAQVSRLGFTISALVKEISVREGDKVQAGQSLAVLNTPELEYAIAAADASYQAARVNAELQNAGTVRVINPRNGRSLFAGLPKEKYLIAEAKMAQAQAALETAKANLALGTMLSPFDGTVVSVNVIPGELVQADQAVITLAALDDLQIETTDLSERDIARVSIGQSVNVYFQSLDLTVTGRVIRISPRADTLGGDVVYPVTIALDEQPLGLLWGMTAEVQIQTK